MIKKIFDAETKGKRIELFITLCCWHFEWAKNCHLKERKWLNTNFKSLNNKEKTFFSLFSFGGKLCGHGHILSAHISYLIASGIYHFCFVKQQRNTLCNCYLNRLITDTWKVTTLTEASNELWNWRLADRPV